MLMIMNNLKDFIWMNMKEKKDSCVNVILNILIVYLFLIEKDVLVLLVG